MDVVKRFLPDEYTANVKFLLGDARSLPFSDNSFDGIVAMEIIEHLEDDVSFLRECLRVLKHGGTLLLTTTNRLRLTALVRYLVFRPLRFPCSYGEDPVLGDVVHVREYSYSDLMELTRKVNVKECSIKGVWFGVPWFGLGIAGPFELFFLRNFAYDLHMELIKR
jgi:ubiquinone/menaquinone biosynthesis C-methylase UbiE